MASPHTLPGGNIVKVPDYGDAADVPASLKLYGESLESALVPVGVVLPYAGLTNAIPDGWLLCDGSTFSGTDYPRLQAVLGRTTTPNMTGRMPIGVSGSDPDIDATFKAAGSKTIASDQVPVPSHGHTATVAGLAAAEGGSHGHSLSGDGSHGHSTNVVGNVTAQTNTNTSGGGNLTRVSSINVVHTNISGTGQGTHSHAVASNGVHTHTVTGAVTVNDAAGTGASRGYLPPALALNFIIRGR